MKRTQRVDLNLLVVFDAIYRLRNLTVAGESLGLSQPAMSHALARLRRSFGDTLFVKQPRGLQPTPYADEIAPVLANSLAAIRGTLDRVGFDPAASRRVFRIAMTDIGERILLPGLCRHLLERAPGIALETRQPPVRELREAMAAGDIDLAMGFIPQLGTGFRQRQLYRSAYACVVRQDHPVIHGSLSLKQYREAAHVLAYSSATAHGDTIEQALAGAGVTGPVTARITHFLAIAAIVASTDCIATIPKNLAQALRQLVKVRVLAAPVALPPFDIKLYWHERCHLDPGNQWLRGVCAGLMKA